MTVVARARFAGGLTGWVGAVLGDAGLARALTKIERSTRAGATPDCKESVAYIDDRYQVCDLFRVG